MPRLRKNFEKIRKRINIIEIKDKNPRKNLFSLLESN